MSIINSHTGFQPLQEVWLGDCYPTQFYDHFESKERDFFQEITQRTHDDLKKIEDKIKSFGITIRRPEFPRIDFFLDEQDNLCKPPICPRDWALTLGNTLWVLPQYYSGFEPFENAIKDYRQSSQQVKILDRSIPEPMCYVPFPSVVRVGQDVYLDSHTLNEYFMAQASELAKKYRVHISTTGDHSDGVFCPIRPKQIFSTHYLTVYEKTFPGWDVFFLPNTTLKRAHSGYSSSWWVEGMNYQIFNPEIVKRAANWIGDARETVFEVNMLVIDEKNVLCIAEDDAACKKLESLGITPHVLDFKTRGFWDGGLHCLTLDIYRQGSCIDYWPDRGSVGLYYG